MQRFYVTKYSIPDTWIGIDTKENVFLVTYEWLRRYSRNNTWNRIQELFKKSFGVNHSPIDLLSSNSVFAFKVDCFEHLETVNKMWETKGKILGFLNIVYWEVPSIFNVCVDPEYQGRGLGSAMIKSVLEFPIDEYPRDYYWISIVDTPKNNPIKLVNFYANAYPNKEIGNFMTVGRINDGRPSIVMVFIRGIYQEPAYSIELAKHYQFGKKITPKFIPNPKGEITVSVSKYSHEELVLMYPIPPGIEVIPYKLRNYSKYLVELFWDDDVRSILVPKINKQYRLNFVSFYLLRDIAKNKRLVQEVLKVLTSDSKCKLTPLTLYEKLPDDLKIEYSQCVYGKVEDIKLVEELPLEPRVPLVVASKYDY